MRFPVILLRITSVLFIAFGVAFVAFPQDVAELVTDGFPIVPSAVTDMRATYGGVPLGLGLFVGLCARRTDWLRPGLIVSLLVIACIGMGRLVGIIVDGSPNAFMIVFLSTEVVSVALFAVAVRRVSSSAA